MRKFAVKVNGVVYDVEVEEIATAGTPVPSVQAAPVAPVAPIAPVASAPIAPAPAPAVEAPVAEAKPAPVQAGSGEGTPVKAPFPGTVVKVNASVGASVKKGDVLLVLEAMKMENDICSPVDGVVTSLPVSQGAAVGTDELLATVK